MHVKRQWNNKNQVEKEEDPFVCIILSLNGNPTRQYIFDNKELTSKKSKKSDIFFILNFWSETLIYPWSKYFYQRYYFALCAERYKLGKLNPTLANYNYNDEYPATDTCYISQSS